MSNLDDTLYWSGVAAEELSKALSAARVDVLEVGVDARDGDVTVIFPHIGDAEALLTLAVDSRGGPGSLYDRVAEGCVSSEKDAEVTSAEIGRFWNWDLHPYLSGRRVGWHVRLFLNAPDANELTATLNTLARGGAL